MFQEYVYYCPLVIPYNNNVLLIIHVHISTQMYLFYEVKNELNCLSLRLSCKLVIAAMLIDVMLLIITDDAA